MLKNNWASIILSLLEKNGNTSLHSCKLDAEKNLLILNFHFIYPAENLYLKTFDNKIKILSSIKYILAKNFSWQGIVENEYISFIINKPLDLILSFPKEATDKNQLENIILTVNIKISEDYKEKDDYELNIEDSKKIFFLKDTLNKLENIFKFSKYLDLFDDELEAGFREKMIKEKNLSKESFLQGLQCLTTEPIELKCSSDFSDPSLYVILGYYKKAKDLNCYYASIKYGKIQLKDVHHLSIKDKAFCKKINLKQKLKENIYTSKDFNELIKKYPFLTN